MRVDFEIVDFFHNLGHIGFLLAIFTKLYCLDSQHEKISTSQCILLLVFCSLLKCIQISSFCFFKLFYTYWVKEEEDLSQTKLSLLWLVNFLFKWIMLLTQYFGIKRFHPSRMDQRTRMRTQSSIIRISIIEMFIMKRGFLSEDLLI